MDVEWRENGRREGRRWRPRSGESDTSLCIGDGSGPARPCLTSLYV